jgi:hypothetical protein
MMSREDASSFKLRQLATKQDAYRGYTNPVLPSTTRWCVSHHKGFSSTFQRLNRWDRAYRVDRRVMAGKPYARD